MCVVKLRISTHLRGLLATLARSLALLSYGEVWARRNVYSAPPRYYKCTATHGTPRGTHGGPRGVVQQIPKGGYNIQGVSTLTPHIWRCRIAPVRSCEGKGALSPEPCFFGRVDSGVVVRAVIVIVLLLLRRIMYFTAHPCYWLVEV